MPTQLLLIVGVLGAIMALLTFWPEPKLIVWPDSIGYLGPALDALETGEFSHWYGRGFVYSGFLYALLRIAPEPWVIVLAQRLILLATFACLAIACAIASSPLTSQSLRPYWVGSVAFVFWMLVFMLYPPLAGLAHAVMPEVLAAFLLALVLLATIAATVLRPRPETTIFATASAMFLSIALMLVRPHWLLSAAILPGVLLWAAPRANRRLVLRGVVVGLVAAAVLLIWPEARLQQRYDAYTSRILSIRNLFCSNADVIHPYLAQRTDGFSREVHGALGRILDLHARAAARDWTSIGFNSDDCTYGETGRLVAQRFAGDVSGEIRFYTSTYVAAIAQQPSYVVGRLVRQLYPVIARPFAAVATDYFVRADDDVVAVHQARPILREWLTQADWFSESIELPAHAWPLATRLFFAGAGFVLLAVTIAAGVRIVGIGGRPPRLVGAPFLIVLACVISLNLFVATVHTFEPRYLAIQAPLFCMLGFTASITACAAVPGQRRRRVLMVTGAYHPEISSSALQCRDMARLLDGRAEMRVLTTAVDRHLRRRDVVDGVHVSRVFVDVTSRLSKLIASVRMVAALVRLLPWCDVVHIHGFSTKNVIVTGAARIFGRPVVLSLHTAEHDEAPNIRQHSSLAWWAFTRADAYLSVSPRLIEAYLSAGLPQERIRLIPNGIDTDRFRPASDIERSELRSRLGLPLDLPVILFVGFFSQDKQPRVAFDAWMELLDTHAIDAMLLFVGATKSTYFEVDAALEARMRSDASGRNRADHVVFTGLRHDVHDYFRAADVFVLTSRREGLPVVLLEAMACGLPCVASRLPGATDVIIRDMVNGLLIPVGEFRALADALARVLRDNAFAAELGSAARATITQNFTSSDVAAQWLRAYDEVLADPPRRGMMKSPTSEMSKR